VLCPLLLPPVVLYRTWPNLRVYKNSFSHYFIQESGGREKRIFSYRGYEGNKTKSKLHILLRTNRGKEGRHISTVALRQKFVRGADRTHSALRSARRGPGRKVRGHPPLPGTTSCRRASTPGGGITLVERVLKRDRDDTYLSNLPGRMEQTLKYVTQQNTRPKGDPHRIDRVHNRSNHMR